MAGNRRTRSLLVSNGLNQGSIELELSVDLELGTLLLDQGKGRCDLVDQLSLCTSLRGIRKHCHYRLGTQEGPAAECGGFCNLCKLLGCRVGDCGAVGEDQGSVYTVLLLVGCHDKAG